MDGEIWRDIPGFEGKFQVSDTGKIRTLNWWGKPGKVREVKLWYDDKQKHLQLTRTKNTGRITIIVANCVAHAFLNVTPAKNCIVFIDGNRRNCAVNNLKLISRAESVRLAHVRGEMNRKGLKRYSRAVESIDESGNVIRYESATKAGIALECDRSGIVHAIKKGKPSQGLKWRYAS